MKPADQGLKAKSRLVAKAFVQPIEDKDELYASTPLLTAVRTSLTLALNNDWHIQTADVSTAFLHAPLTSQTEMYIIPPQGYGQPDELWKLNKAMYGLKTSPRDWQMYFGEQMEILHWRKLKDGTQHVNFTHKRLRRDLLCG